MKFMADGSKDQTVERVSCRELIMHAMLLFTGGSHEMAGVQRANH